MYLRQRNIDSAAQQRQLVLDQTIARLKASVLPVATPSDALARLELGGILSWQGTYHPALDLVSPLLDEAFSLDIRLRAQQLIADTHFRHDQYDLANRAYHKNLEMAQQKGDAYWIARAREGLGWVLIDVGQFATGEFEEAERIFEENLSIHRVSANRIPEGMVLYGLSRAAAGRGVYDVAIQRAVQSIEVLEAHSGHHLLQLPILQLANVYRDDGRFDLSEPYYDLAIDAADRSQDPYAQVLIIYQYGLLKRFKGDHIGAYQLWNSVLPTIREFDFPRIGSETSEALSLLAALRGDYETAYRLQIESRDYGNRIGVISPILHNQQMTLRSAMHQTGQLEAKLNYLTAGVEAIEDGIFVLGPPGTSVDRSEFVIHFANSAAAQMIGKQPVDITHVPIRTIWKSASALRLIEPSRKVFETGQRLTFDPVLLEFMEGHPRWYAVKIAKIPDGVAWTVIDVSERETMRQEILAQRDRLEEANARLTDLDREKSEVLGIAAHDLRSPIGNIRGLCDVILNDPSKTAEAAVMIESTTEALLSLLANLLDVERIENGKFEVNLQSAEVAPILSEVIAQYQVSAADKNITLDAICLGESPRVLVDVSAFQRVIQNLLSNALKFSPLGSQVIVRTMNCEQYVRIEIVDQGPGVSLADRKGLFGKFARLSARPTGGESSSGLGLSIVKHLVLGMNGRFGCESEPGEGATFWVEFPITAKQ